MRYLFLLLSSEIMLSFSQFQQQHSKCFYCLPVLVWPLQMSIWEPCIDLSVAYFWVLAQVQKRRRFSESEISIEGEGWAYPEWVWVYVSLTAEQSVLVIVFWLGILHLFIWMFPYFLNVWHHTCFCVNSNIKWIFEKQHSVCKELYHFLLHRCDPLWIWALPCFITAALSLMIQETSKNSISKITLRCTETGKQWSESALLPACYCVM